MNAYSLDMHDPVAVAIDLATDAMSIMTKWFEAGTSVETKFDQSPVTEADIEINDMVVSRLSAAFPEHGLIGEERSGVARPDAEYTWLCDPVDGTRPFAMGLPISTFALALTHQGRPVVGVIAWPFRDWMWVAEAGSGTRLNGEVVTVSPDGPFARVVDVLTAQKLSSWVPGLADELGADQISCLTLNSVAISAGLVACGRMGGAVWSGDTPWDAAAGKVVVEEAGGVFTDLHGNDQRYDQPVAGFVAGTPKVHQEIVAAVTKCGVEQGRRKNWTLAEHLA